MTEPTRTTRLAPRERTFAELFVLGLRISDIARTMGVKHGTVQGIKCRIAVKVGMPDAHSYFELRAAMRRALEQTGSAASPRRQGLNSAVPAAAIFSRGPA